MAIIYCPHCKKHHMMRSLGRKYYCAVAGKAYGIREIEKARKEGYNKRIKGKANG